MFKAITQIYLSVDDVERSRDFYCVLLGLEHDREHEVPGEFAMIVVDDVEFCFHRADAKNPKSTGGAIPYWRVADFESFVEHAKQFGCTMYRGPISIKGTDRIMGQMQDPFGQVFGIEA